MPPSLSTRSLRSLRALLSKGDRFYFASSHPSLASLSTLCPPPLHAPIHAPPPHAPPTQPAKQAVLEESDRPSPVACCPFLFGVRNNSSNSSSSSTRHTAWLFLHPYVFSTRSPFLRYIGLCFSPSPLFLVLVLVCCLSASSIPHSSSVLLPRSQSSAPAIFTSRLQPRLVHLVHLALSNFQRSSCEKTTDPGTSGGLSPYSFCRV